MNKPDLHNASKWAPAIICAILVATIIGGFAYGISSVKGYVASIAAKQDTNAPKINQTRQAANAAKHGVAILEDCLTPGGKCNQQTQANQAEILKQVSDLQTYHALCIRNDHVAHTVPAVNSCVDQLIRQYGLGDPHG